MGKGSTQRPRDIDYAEWVKRYDAAFGKGDEMKELSKTLEDEEYTPSGIAPEGDDS